MNKPIACYVVCFLALFCAFAQQSGAYINVNHGCTACHDFSTLHANHSHCMKCHDGSVSKNTVYPSACATCHPSSSPGKCNLIKKHADNPQKTCLLCHTECSSSPPSCIDTDGDGYGDNCTLGPDCDDTDNTTFNTCEIDCTLTVAPKRFSRIRALLQPFQFFTIRADRNNDISFTDPICIFWESEGIDDVIKLRIGEKLIIGYVRVWASHLTDGDFKVSVTFGDTDETQCGPITVRGSAASSFIQPNRVKLQNKCGK